VGLRLRSLVSAALPHEGEAVWLPVLWIDNSLLMIFVLDRRAARSQEVFFNLLQALHEFKEALQCPTNRDHLSFRCSASFFCFDPLAQVLADCKRRYMGEGVRAN